MPIKNLFTIKYLILIVIAFIFTGEVLIMLLRSRFPPLSEWHEALLDASLLSVFVFPLMYLMVVNPFKTQITQLEQSKKNELEIRNRLQKIASQVPGIVFQFQRRPEGSFCMPYANENLFEIYRVNPEQVREDATYLFNVIHPDDLADYLKAIHTSMQRLTPWISEYRVKFGEEPECWLTSHALPQRLADGSTIWHGFIFDITERKKIDTELRVTATALESHVCMMITDANKVILRVNTAFTQTTGYTAEECVGQTPRLFNSGLNDAQFYRELWETLLRTGTWQGKIWDRRKNGEIYLKSLSLSTVKDKDGIITHYVGVDTDITKNKAVLDEIERLAFYDPLTDLPNRRLLRDRLGSALASSHRSGRIAALLFIDIDDFKSLNDSLGHDMGDLLLKQVAERLKTNIRACDTVARLGGDEFGVILEDLSTQTLEAAAQTETVGHKILTLLNQPFQLTDHAYHCTSSIGASFVNGHEHTVDELLKQADIALSQAKIESRNVLRFFDPQMQANITARVALGNELRVALVENQFELFYQPQVYHNHQIIGAEVLIRWRHPQRGLIPPLDFIPLAEESGLILPIGQWVLETACAQIKRWEGSDLTRNLQLAVNVSARQFRQPDFVEQVLQTLKHCVVNPNSLKLELTETLVLIDIDDTIIKMQALREIGVRFSMDDFGTGYSSLSNLNKLPIDQLKIDQSFVRDISSDPDDSVIVQTIIVMANKLGMEVIAEGVETKAQSIFLAQSGCPIYQGYLFSKPVPLAEFEQLLKGPLAAKQ